MSKEITFGEIAVMQKDEYVIIDIRSEESYSYGHITGSINIPAEKIQGAELPRGKRLYIACKTGTQSAEVAVKLREKGYPAYSVKGGYMEWLRRSISGMEGGDKTVKIEESIRRKFHKKLFSRFTSAIVEYGLVKPNDSIAVCISGGKDSFLMAKLFQELKRHNKFDFSLTFLVMDPGYSPANREMIERNAKLLGVPVTIFETDIFENVFNIEKSPCYICARMRRGNLYANAKELGCNKIALGHHFDDVIETTLMGMLYGAQMQTMMPKVKSENFEGMELIRPMYLIREDDIKAWCNYNGLQFIQCACKFTENCTSEACKTSDTGSKRLKVKNLIRKLAAEDPEIEQNIFKSAENVNLSTIISYKDKNGARHRFDE